jgi:hypothetical protein
MLMLLIAVVICYEFRSCLRRKYAGKWPKIPKNRLLFSYFIPSLPMAKRKRATRSASLGNTLVLATPKLGTAKHEKSQGALRRAQKMALKKDATEH